MGLEGAQRAWFAVSAGICGIAWASAAAGAEDAEAIHLSYDAPGGCPREEAFLDMVAADGGRLVRAAQGEAARSFSVRVEAHGGKVAGKVFVHDDAAADAVREIEGANCEDVVRSLAVLVALSVEPPAHREAPPSAPDRPAEPQEAPEPLTPPAGRVERASRSEQAEPGESFELRPGWHLDASAGGTFSTGGSHNLNSALALYFEMLDEVPDHLAPSIRVGVEIAADWSTSGASFSSSSAAPGATYRRSVGRVDACMWRAVVSRPWSADYFTLTPCARLDVGRLEAAGPITVDRPWVAPAAIARLRWASPNVFLEMEGGVTFPLIRERFESSPPFEIPPVAFTSGVGLGWVFL